MPAIELLVLSGVAGYNEMTSLSSKP